jgi:hypothetical protein
MSGERGYLGGTWGRYVNAAKYWTPLKAAQAIKTATHTAAKDLFFHTIRGIIHVFWSFSRLRSHNRKAGNRTTLITVNVIGIGATHFPGPSATILESVSHD